MSNEEEKITKFKIKPQSACKRWKSKKLGKDEYWTPNLLGSKKIETIGMRELYFTSPYRRSTRTIRLEYGQVKKVFILRTYDGEIKSRGESENPPKEELFDDEQEMLKKVYETKSGLLEGRWIVQNKQSISQPSFISTSVVDGEVSVEFNS
jgi:hypothetical protein